MNDMVKREFFDGSPVTPGADWQCTLTAEGSVYPMFPTGSTFSANVKYNVRDASSIATLTTGAGNFARTDDNNLVVLIKGTDSASWLGERIVFDLWRTDVTPHQYMAIKIGIPLNLPT